ncbi:hypothetical protein PN466_01795 [Roseofilum reptotaenium CS-1145]|uniref:Contractile injection system tube protein N-terminal domain-containing protein n=1 Tax=Roseofilum reptotaenium AO1-A TaxID=1925591 RepID=A0A1L9QK70_9CYAN|nr:MULTISPECIES: hypothetical protein [Roseofilum]MBP0027870.1 hypothetical protein [Roseofilum sp. Guam]MDB9515693.1 hypothetical protein [Roseofilum reptotaenium CS-1145]OJJ16208.1 hypothetical protein BI308_23775 [Roseofilum reptotaenium AO1-A]
MGLSDALTSATKGAVLTGADLLMMEAAISADKERENIYDIVEAEKQKAALQLYQQQFLQGDVRLVKAALIPRDGEASSIIRFMFNPEELRFNRSVKIEDMQGARTERGLPKVNFGFVEPYKLTLSNLIFDTYESGTNVLTQIQPLLDAVDFSSFKDPFDEQKVTVNGKNYSYQERTLAVSLGDSMLSSFTKSISGVDVYGLEEYGSENLSKQAIELRRPPVFYFIWGDKIYMRCMVESLDYSLNMFRPNGVPVRAVVTLNLKEVDLGVASRKFSERQSFVQGAT